MAKELKNLTKRSENYSQWYNELVVKAVGSERVYGYQTIWVRHMGKDAANS